MIDLLTVANAPKGDVPGPKGLVRKRIARRTDGRLVIVIGLVRSAIGGRLVMVTSRPTAARLVMVTSRPTGERLVMVIARRTDGRLVMGIGLRRSAIGVQLVTAIGVQLATGTGQPTAARPVMVIARPMAGRRSAVIVHPGGGQLKVEIVRGMAGRTGKVADSLTTVTRNPEIGTSIARGRVRVPCVRQLTSVVT